MRVLSCFPQQFNDPATPAIMRRYFHQHLIAWPHADKIHFFAAGRVRQNLFAAFQLNPYYGAWH